MKTPNDSYHGKTVFATGIAVMALAALLAVQITLRPVPVAQNSPQSDPAAVTTVRSDRSSQAPVLRHPDPRSRHKRPSHMSGEAATSAARSSVGTTDDRPFRLEVPREHPDRSRLANEAERLAAHANKRLDVLTRQLDLAPEQREKLFPLLARSSASYDRAMIAADSDGQPLPLDAQPGIEQADPVELSAAMAAMMEPLQQDEWIERQVNDAALWREIFTNLQRQLEEQTPAIPAATEEVMPSGRRNIFDLMEPAD